MTQPIVCALEAIEVDHQDRDRKPATSPEPFELFVDLNVTADRLFGAGDLALCYHMGRFGADVNLTTLYRVFYKLGSPGFIMSRAAKVWGVNYDSGRLVWEGDEAHGLTMRIEDFATPHRAHCLSVLGWAARSIELSGGTLHNAIEHVLPSSTNGFCFPAPCGSSRGQWSDRVTISAPVRDGTAGSFTALLVIMAGIALLTTIFVLMLPGRVPRPTLVAATAAPAPAGGK